MQYIFEIKRRRKSPSLLYSNNVFRDKKNHEVKNKSNTLLCKSRPVCGSCNSQSNMHKIAKVGLISGAILLFFVVIILLLNLNSLKSDENQPGTCVILDGRQTCYSKDPNPYRNYGTKTAYHAVLENNDEPLNLKDCTPKVFYMLSRHATRYPDKEYIVYINKYLPGLKEQILNSSAHNKAKLCEEDINKLREWFPTMESKDQNQLSITGSQESEELGERLKERFSEILNVSYSPETFVIEYTSRERTKDTAENFARGLFDEKNYKKINFEGKTNDKVLQFHKDCKNMRKKCSDPKYNIEEIEKFANSSLMKKVVTSVSKRIGFTVSPEDIKHMYVACTFGFALNISDAWCAVFSTDDLKVLEFQDDIDDYYKDSYGNEVNYKQACPVIHYIVDLFRSYEKKNEKKVILQFSHAGGIKKVYAALGLFHDEHPLTADSFCDLNNRKWRSSTICPFNTNIVFVLYDCNGSLKFITLHNEKPVILDGCDDKLCSISKFYEKYQTTAQNCDLKKICCNAQ